MTFDVRWRAWGAAALAALMASACGADGGGAGGGDAGGGAGGGATPATPDAPRQGPPANVVGGFRVELPSSTLAPGEETYPCFVAPLVLEGPSKVVGGANVTVGKGMHHGNVTARPKTGEGFRPCPEGETGALGGEAGDVIAGGSVLFGSTTQFEGTEWRTFPDGMGFPIGDEWEVVFRMHYLNPTQEELTLAPSYEWFTIDEASVTHLLGPFAWRMAEFSIPPNQELTVSTDCWAPAPTFIVDLMPHMHALGTRFEARYLGGALDGQPFLDSPGYNPDGLIASYEPPVAIGASEGFRWGCTWQNTFDKTIVEGTGDDEMCMAFGYAYPYEAAYSALATPDGACVLVGPPPPKDGASAGGGGAGGG